MQSETVPDVAAFFDSYRAAFERFDAVAIAALFAYPGHVAADAGAIALTPVTAEDEWIAQIAQLVAAYARAGVASARVEKLAATELSPRLYQAVLQWALHDADGKTLYRFDACYTLVRIDHALRIAALAHNELPRLQACLARQQAAAREE